jgi:hypothetical protein
MTRTNIKLNQRMQRIVDEIVRQEPVLTGGSPTAAVEVALIEWRQNHKEDAMDTVQYIPGWAEQREAMFELLNEGKIKRSSPVWYGPEGGLAIGTASDLSDYGDEYADYTERGNVGEWLDEWLDEAADAISRDDVIDGLQAENWAQVRNGFAGMERDEVAVAVEEMFPGEDNTAFIAALWRELDA